MKNTISDLSKVETRNKRYRLIDCVIERANKRILSSFKVYCKVTKNHSEEDRELFARAFADVGDNAIVRLQEQLDEIKNADDKRIDELYAELIGND